MGKRGVRVGERRIDKGELFVIAGPCVLESRSLALEIAQELARICGERDVPLVFKASYDKANRTSLEARRGPGVAEGLAMLGEVRERTGLPILTDVHSPTQCAEAAEVADVLQVPAFLCRQTDLLVAAAETGRCVNVKKGQFLSPADMQHVANKLTGSGAEELMLTERGVSFGYGRLVVDMTGFRELSATGHAVVFDATHAVQRPGAGDGKTGGDRSLAPPLARAAVATGEVDGPFFEVHPDPDSSPSDGPNMIRLEDFSDVLDGVLRVHRAVRDES